MSHTVTVTVAAVERRANTVNGNPRYWILTDQGRFTTANDAAMVFDANPEKLVGHQVELTVDGTGVIDAQVRDGR